MADWCPADVERFPALARAGVIPHECPADLCSADVERFPAEALVWWAATPRGCQADLCLADVEHFPAEELVWWAAIRRGSPAHFGLENSGMTSTAVEAVDGSCFPPRLQGLVRR